jgi:hypothetical protein
MDLLELRLLAVSGILAIGVALSVLAVAGAALAGWVGRLWHARPDGRAGAPVTGKASGLGVGQARC